MIFIDNLENIAEPNQGYAQQNLHSPTLPKGTILVDFQGTVRRRFDKQTINFFLYLVLFSFPNLLYY